MLCRRPFLHVVCALLCILSAFVSGCAGRGPEVSVPAAFSEEQTTVFRHKVTVTIAGRPPLSLDGMMRLGLGNDKPLVRVIGLGGIGLTLFDLMVDLDGQNTLYMHPSLVRVPDLAEHIALCVRSVWLERLGQTPEASFAVLPSSNSRNLDIVLSRERPWPRTITVHHARPEYRVTVRLVNLQESGLEK